MPEKPRLNRKMTRLFYKKRLVSMLAIFSIAIAVAACGPESYSNDTTSSSLATSGATAQNLGAKNTQVASTATVGVTPTTPAEMTPTATVGITPTATANTNQTAARGLAPTAVVVTPTAPPPTKTPVPPPTAVPTAPLVSNKTVTTWIQVTDSCKQALSGATFTVTGPGINTTTVATQGSTPQSLSGAIGCPIQEGNCSSTLAGCTSVALPVPATGIATYKITVARTAPGMQLTGSTAYGANWTYAICQGGSDCRHGPEVATVAVTSSGSVSATVLNIYPDGVAIQWPTNKSAYGAIAADPIMFHEFGISQTSGAVNQCDGDHDADDYLTGTPGMHCDSDGD